jgi:exopolysaccharide production protein ExoZ
MIWSLQNLRFVAALMVVYIHAVLIAGTASENGFIPLNLAIAGRAGVDIFFVLSGFIITKTAQGISAEEFAWRRFRRIIPLYLVWCVPVVLIAAQTGFGWREALATFALWPATDQMTAPLVMSGWTLCFEVLFYTATALVLIDRRWLFALLGLYAAAMALRSTGPMPQFLGNPIIAEFLLGALLFYAPRGRLAVLALPIGAALIILAGPLGIAPQQGRVDGLLGAYGFQRLFVYGIPAALIVYGTLQIETKQSVWSYLGDASYSLYLVHYLLLRALGHLWTIFPLSVNFTIPVSMAAAVLFALLIHEQVEKPILRAFGAGSRMFSRRQINSLPIRPPSCLVTPCQFQSDRGGAPGP